MEIKIELMQLSDLMQISPLLLSEFDDFWSQKSWESELKNTNSYCFVFKVDSKIRGLAAIWLGVEEVHLTNIVIQKSFRQKGFGNQFLNYIFSFCESLPTNCITLEVSESNLAAITLYEKFGFETVGIRKKYYNGMENAIIMTKHITKKPEK